MSQDYSKKEKKKEDGSKVRPVINSIIRATIIIGWVVVGFVIAQQLTVLLIKLLIWLNIPLASMNEILLTTIFSVVIYLFTIGFVIGLPWFFKKRKTSWGHLGLDRLPNWMDLWTAPAGFVIYIIVSAVLLSYVSSFPWFNIDQAQDVGFNGLTVKYEYIMAFITLVVVAPIAEEVLFRGYLFGKLRKFMPLWVAIALTSLAFGAIHGAWNIALDTFALSIVLCTLRVVTGSLWAPILLHMIKNSIAFYILFINPTLFTTLGG